MLILGRKRGECIVIGGNVRVKVLDIEGNYIHLGIDAPPEVSIHREEIYERIQEENRRARALPPGDLKEISAMLMAARREVTAGEPGK